MKLKGIVFGLLAAFLSAPLVGQAADTTMANPAAQGNLTVQVTGLKNDNGVVRIALFNDQQDYENKDPNAPGAYKKDKLPIKNGVAVWQLSNLPYGEYAIKLYHDEDNSGKLKKNLVGRPKEGVGFSNNPKLDNHAPSYDQVKFTVGQPSTNMAIKIINP